MESPGTHTHTLAKPMVECDVDAHNILKNTTPILSLHYITEIIKETYTLVESSPEVTKSTSYSLVKYVFLCNQ